MVPSRRYNQNWLPSIFNDLFDNDWIERSNASVPAINVLEDEKGYNLELAAPGLTKDDFQVSLDEDNDLVIKMEKKEETKDEGKKKGRFLRHEFSYAKFQQTMVLPDDVDREKISATVQDGVLKVALPKIENKEVPQSKKMIEIK
ncbi:MAG: Hsp20/alpha crystallin family protein [Bacteroidales bacterium]|jgi:HSP20 family protein|nr:Hsp20/alpha crystallin family protein [Bacteroidales bacterium]MDY2936299.1 Hsp20/alpha crystallin family protein [Candidatus Cryptobacteroides sp.]MCI2108475.1 Hsp20/alpha crystallin family protein [Bacteroidales bacterium]MCI2132845.1 Hsp20/alpha crystallin family protein [Bacteroidales bacterium]MCI2135001.1 Hsp20/alpha crystallin family protein [Bacteroidales bacterium]